MRDPHPRPSDLPWGRPPPPKSSDLVWGSPPPTSLPWGDVAPNPPALFRTSFPVGKDGLATKPTITRNVPTKIKEHMRASVEVLRWRPGAFKLNLRRADERRADPGINQKGGGIKA